MPRVGKTLSTIVQLKEISWPIFASKSAQRFASLKEWTTNVCQPGKPRRWTTSARSGEELKLRWGPYKPWQPQLSNPIQKRQREEINPKQPLYHRTNPKAQQQLHYMNLNCRRRKKKPFWKLPAESLTKPPTSRASIAFMRTIHINLKQRHRRRHPTYCNFRPLVIRSSQTWKLQLKINGFGIMSHQLNQVFTRIRLLKEHQRVPVIPKRPSRNTKKDWPSRLNTPNIIQR